MILEVVHAVNEILLPLVGLASAIACWYWTRTDPLYSHPAGKVIFILGFIAVMALTKFESTMAVNWYTYIGTVLTIVFMIGAGHHHVAALTVKMASDRRTEAKKLFRCTEAAMYIYFVMLLEAFLSNTILFFEL